MTWDKYCFPLKRERTVELVDAGSESSKDSQAFFTKIMGLLTWESRSKITSPKWYSFYSSLPLQSAEESSIFSYVIWNKKQPISSPGQKKYSGDILNHHFCLCSPSHRTRFEIVSFYQTYILPLKTSSDFLLYGESFLAKKKSYSTK